MIAARYRALLAVATVMLLGGSNCSGGGHGNQSAQNSATSTSCYARSPLHVPAPAPAHALFVLIDQTTGLDEDLQRGLKEKVSALLTPGTAYTISTFSAYSHSNRPTLTATGAIEAPIPQSDRPNLSVKHLQDLDACLGLQRTYLATQAATALDKATGAASSSFSNSEIFAGLTQLAQAVKDSPAPEKIVVVVSDLMEHSSVTSFYANRNLRRIDTPAELAKVEKVRLFGDFGGARIFVMGAGLLSPESTSAGRDLGALDNLHDFWEQWFKRSHADLAEYGQPDLLTTVAWQSP